MQFSNQKFLAWLVHFFTALGGVFGLLALFSIHQSEYKDALWYMVVAVVIDAVDGTLARAAHVKVHAPELDGDVLDGVVDFLNYVVVPAFFMLVSEMLLQGSQVFISSLVVLASSYQFSQIDAKTSDNFFKGFPSYWNIVVLYLFIWDTPAVLNSILVLVFVGLIFVPIKYVYPSRLKYFAKSELCRKVMLISTLLWGAVTIGLLWIYPEQSIALNLLTAAYLLWYGGVSVYRSFNPISS